VALTTTLRIGDDVLEKCRSSCGSLQKSTLTCRTALSVLRLCLGFHSLLTSGIPEFTTTTDDRIKELSAKLLRAENPSVIMMIAEQLKVAIETYVREHSRHIPAVKETTFR